MPNWVRCEVNMRGLAKTPFINKETDSVDFNGVIPMPKGMIDLTAGGMEDESITLVLSRLAEVIQKDKPYGFQKPVQINIPESTMERTEKRVELFEEDEDKLIEDGLRYIANAVRYGSLDWYKWANKNWGTKWNPDPDDSNYDDDYACFQTAWDAPIPVIRKLSEMYPNDEIIIEWADEGLLHAGKATFLNGEMVEGGYDETDDEILNHFIDEWGYDPTENMEDEDDEEGMEELTSADKELLGLPKEGD